MTIRYVDEYETMFGEPPPNMYMSHLPDDECNAMLKKALDAGKPIDSESLVPPGLLPGDTFM